MTAPRRRWFRFSLRTLFVVVTALGCWAGWQFKIVHDRLAIRARLDEETGDVCSGDGEHWPWWRTMLGDHEIRIIFLPPNCDPAFRDELRALFPEAERISNPDEDFANENAQWLGDPGEAVRPQRAEDSPTTAN